ncbi:MAG: molybdenum cofactor biosynthesis protein MoaE [Phycisphaerae bacterium]|nr:molybdenum cofactor biosynthesis protein MoaE [Phycisphaerae bacterium]
MRVEASIVDGPLAPAAAFHADGAGSLLVFEGVVRPREGDRDIGALDYTAYDPMALRQLERLARDVAERFGLLALRVEHSRGRVPVGACSFRLAVASPHRKESLAAIDEFIDRLKRDVPIWKSPPGLPRPPGP